MSAALVTRERERLAQLEDVVARGLETFVEVGTALAEIRDERLYRETHGTFEDYCRERWSLGRAHAYRLIDSAGVVRVLSPIGDTPANEAQARELVPLAADERQAIEAWREAQAEAERHGKQITAKTVRLAVRKRLRLIQWEVALEKKAAAERARACDGCGSTDHDQGGWACGLDTAWCPECHAARQPPPPTPEELEALERRHERRRYGGTLDDVVRSLYETAELLLDDVARAGEMGLPRHEAERLAERLAETARLLLVAAGRLRAHAGEAS